MEAPCCAKHINYKTNGKTSNKTSFNTSDNNVKDLQDKIQLCEREIKILESNEKFYKEQFELCMNDKHKLQLEYYKKEMQYAFLNMIILVLAFLVVIETSYIFREQEN